MAHAVLLLSGGIESTTLLYETQADLHTALTVDYGQRSAAREFACAQHHCAELGIPLAQLAIPALGQQINAVRPHDFHVPLPSRNLLLFALAANYAQAAGLTNMLIGLTRDDGMADPFSAEGTVALARLLAKSAQVTLLTPYLGLTKTEVVERGLARGLDYTQTYSCLLGHEQPCGGCPQCRHREAALQAARRNQGPRA